MNIVNLGLAWPNIGNHTPGGGGCNDLRCNPRQSFWNDTGGLIVQDCADFVDQFTKQIAGGAAAPPIPLFLVDLGRMWNYLPPPM